jgi:hypothetical protein
MHALLTYVAIGILETHSLHNMYTT